MQTYKNKPVCRDICIGVVNVIDAAVIHHARGVARVYTGIGEIYSVGVHDARGDL